jgi:hypothetical protein
MTCVGSLAHMPTEIFPLYTAAGIGTSIFKGFSNSP